ncbi:MAG: hypothetical protein ACI8XG_000756 [Congregibacter sp.]
MISNLKKGEIKENENSLITNILCLTSYNEPLTIRRPINGKIYNLGLGFNFCILMGSSTAKYQLLNYAAEVTT